MEPIEQLLASSPSLIIPSPYASNQRGNRGVPCRSKKLSSKDGENATEGQGEKSSKNGHSSGHYDKRTTRTTFGPHQDESKWDPQNEKAKHINGSYSRDRIIGDKLIDAPKRGTRSAPNSARRTKVAQASQVAFEVKMADFPELAVVTPGSSGPPVQTRGLCWGPQVQETMSTNKPQPVKEESQVRPHPHQRIRAAKTVSSSNLAGPAKMAPSGMETCVFVAASWANVASQPPRKPVPKEDPTGTQKEAVSTQREEGSSEKKKRKKKKKKPKSSSEETEEPEVYQEPPKFEDEEEFPDLGRALGGTSRLTTGSNTARLCNEESHLEGIPPKLGEQSKDEEPAGKTVEATKKGQKAEKASGKKSKVPFQLDIGTMLEVLEKKQQSQRAKQDAKPVILSVGGALPVSLKQPTVQKKAAWQQDKIAHNPLDSTSPMVKKGKQREVPKAKKPTPLKRVILKEREERKQNRLLQERGLIPQQDSEPATDTLIEQQSETSSTDCIVGPPLPAENQPEGEESSQTDKEESRGEMKEEESGEQLTTEPPSQPTHSRPKIHSRKFRDYCSQVLSKDVDECVTTLLRELVRFQDRLYQKDPMKARMKKRLVMGLREVLKHLRLRKVKCVVISPNCERIQSKGGLDEALHTIIDTCREQGVPFVFALSRKALGRCVNKAVPVSLVGIFNYDGAQDYYHKMIELTSEARKAYEVMLESPEVVGQTDTVQEENPGTQPLGPEPTHQEEPEYIKLWKRMLEKGCNHTFVHFEEQLSSLRLGGELTAQKDEEQQS